ncbi:sugar transferase [Mumia sp. DW29H23]|uniref:sugar transferase n=1 Tax=Mumia sp. DW29H23 TaxID=3421241 RepID=UPI003D685F82
MTDIDYTATAHRRAVSSSTVPAATVPAAPSAPATSTDTATAVRAARGRSLPVAFAYVAAALVGVVVAYLLVDAGPVVWWSVGGAALLLTFEFVATPVYARARSTRPLKKLAWFGGAFLLIGTVADRLTPLQVRAAVVVLGSVAAVVAGSILVHRLAQQARATLLVGDAVGVGHLVRQWQSSRDVDMRGICLVRTPDDESDLRLLEFDGIPVVGGLSSVPEVAQRLDVDEVVVAPGPQLSAYDVRKLSWALARTTVELTVAAEVHGAVPQRIEPRLLGKRLLLSVKPGQRPVPSRVLKGVIDRVGAALLLVVLSPVFLTLAVLVRLDSPGPIIFKQRRTGRDGVAFTMYKFRTMVQNAEELLEELREHNEVEGPLFKMENDPRITRVGRWLRRTSLDELPQIVNVLTGSMSLIGPRPGLPSEAAEYDAWIRHRLSVKPGMTGAWQVGGRTSLAWNEAVRLDLDYVDNQTLTGDLVIAAKTVRTVLRQDGA